MAHNPEPQVSVPGGQGHKGQHGPESSKQSQPGDGALSLVRPGQVCTAARSLVALAGAASFADIAGSAMSSAATVFFVVPWGKQVIADRSGKEYGVIRDAGCFRLQSEELVCSVKYSVPVFQLIYLRWAAWRYPAG